MAPLNTESLASGFLRVHAGYFNVRKELQNNRQSEMLVLMLLRWANELL